MSDLVQIGKPAEANGSAQAAPPQAAAVKLPHTLELPTRYYGRLAVEETVRDFAELITVETKMIEGLLRVTFTRVDQEAGDVISEFLNHALYRSAMSSEEATR